MPARILQLPWKSNMKLVESGYGETGIKLMKILRQRDRHDVKEISLGVQLAGKLESSYTHGDTSEIPSANAIAAMVYELAAEETVQSIERLGLRCGERLLESSPRISSVRIDGTERAWDHVPVESGESRFTFSRRDDGRHTTRVVSSNADVSVESGIEDLVVLKSPTSKGPAPGLTAMAIRARWHYSTTDISYGPSWNGVRKMILETFAEHEARSAQHTLYAIGEMVLNEIADIDEIRLSIEDRGYTSVEPSGGRLASAEILKPADGPTEVVEAVLRR
jgi:urate oxidase